MSVLEELDASIFQSWDDYNQLCVHQRLFVRELLVWLWRNDQSYSTSKSLESLCQAFQWSDDDALVLISKGLPALSGLIEEVYDLQKDGFFIHSEYLLQKKKAMANEVSEVSTLITCKKPSLSKTLEEKKESSTIIYVSDIDKMGNHFDGWLPTIKYDEWGQGYRVRDNVIDTLIKEFPTIDVSLELNNLFTWLKKNSDKRTSSSNMNRMINSWMRRRSEEDLSYSENEISNAFEEL